MTAILKITDGTTSISLIQEGGNAFYLNRWIPAVAQMKAGGSWQQSAFSEGRKLAHYEYGNIVDTFDLKIGDVGQDAVIRKTQDLRQLLDQATEFWTESWRLSGYVWIEAKAVNETNSRYALINSWSTPGDNNPFSQPFMHIDGRAIIDDFTLVLEHGAWMSSAPGESECIEISSLSDAACIPESFVSPRVTASPAANEDDAQCVFLGHGDPNTGLSYYSGTILTVGQPLGSAARYGFGIRFKNVAIPQYACITSAVVRLVAAVTESTTVDARIEGERNAAPDEFQEYVNDDYLPPYRLRTGAYVDWDNIAAWTAGNSYDTPEIKTIIQEIVNLDDWDSGDDIVIFIDDNGSALGNDRTAASYDNVTYNPPQLRVDYWTNVAQGQDETCERQVYVGNQNNKAQLTHVWIDDGGVFGGNLLGTALPYSLLPAVPVANDAIYFGIDEDMADFGPFASLVFDIGTAQNPGSTAVQGQWEYLSVAAAAYRAFNASGAFSCLLFDGTSLDGSYPFQKTGVNSVHWEMPWDGAAPPWTADWDKDTVNGVDGFWVRWRVTSNPGGVTIPTQQNRDPYTVNNNYIDIAADEAGLGDFSSICRLEAEGVSRVGGTVDSPSPGIIVGTTAPNKIWIGSRRLSRGSNFSACIPFSDAQMPYGTSINLLDASASFSDNALTASTGRSIFWDTSAAAAGSYVDLFEIQFNTDVAREYIGTYIPFLAQNAVGSYYAGGNDVTRVEIRLNGRILWQSVDHRLGAREAVSSFPLYLRKMNLPIISVDEDDDISGVTIVIQGNRVSGTTEDYYFNALYLIPVDEWAVKLDCNETETDGFHDGEQLLDNFEYLDIDSTAPKSLLKCLHIDSQEKTKKTWTVNKNGPLSLVPREAQRLWFYTAACRTDHAVMSSQDIHRWEVCMRTRMYGKNRYRSMRGDN